MLPAARSYLEKRFGKSTDLTFDDFMAEVDALRNKDQHLIRGAAACGKVSSLVRHGEGFGEGARDRHRRRCSGRIHSRLGSMTAWR